MNFSCNNFFNLLTFYLNIFLLCWFFFLNLKHATNKSVLKINIFVWFFKYFLLGCVYFKIYLRLIERWVILLIAIARLKDERIFGIFGSSSAFWFPSVVETMTSKTHKIWNWKKIICLVEEWKTVEKFFWKFPREDSLVIWNNLFPNNPLQLQNNIKLS